MHPSTPRGFAMAWAAALLLSAEVALGDELAHPAEEPTSIGSPTEATASDGPPWVFGRTAEIFQQSGDRVATRIAGWADASYRDNDVPGRSASLEIDHLNLFVDTRFRAWQLFVEAEYEQETNHTGFGSDHELELEQAWLRFRWSDQVEIRAGRFNPPFGYWAPVHWSILMDTIEVPLHIGREFVPEHQIGVEVAGVLFPRPLASLGTQLRYAVYAGHGGEAINQEAVDGLTFGGDLRLRLDERYLVGLSLYRQRGREFDGHRERSLVLYGEARLPGRLTLRSEWVHQHRSQKTNSNWDEDISVVYAKIRWDFWRKMYLNYRFSYGDDEDGGVAVEQAIHTLTLGVQPHPAVRLKLEYSDHRFRGGNSSGVGSRRDFGFWGISAGVLF